MHAIGQMLGALGRHGPVLLVAALVLGCGLPILASQARALLPLAAFLLTLGSFLTAALSPPESDADRRTLPLALLWAGLGVPGLIAAATFASGVDPVLRAGILLAVLAPPVGSAAAIAGMLGLRPRLALLASIILTLLAPATIPAVGSLLGLNVAVDTIGLAVHLVLIVGAAGVMTTAVLKGRAVTQALVPGPAAASGIAVLGLVLVGLAMADGVRAQWSADASAFAQSLELAVGLNLGLCALGAALFWWLGPRAACTIGLVGGNRNVTLAWAAAGSTLPPAAEAYVAACIVPILALPLLVRRLTSVRRRVAGRQAHSVATRC